MIHHYTNIDTLALILANRCLRFNRLDRVDDTTEASAFSKHNLARFLFVSCWTLSQTESIPQWHMYTDKMTGVRISLPRNLFPPKKLVLPPKWREIFQGDLYSPVGLEHIWGDKYFLLPWFLGGADFGRDVTYVESLDDIYEEYFDLRLLKDGKAQLTLKQVRDFGTYKKDDWAFQQEFRFVLFALPPASLPEDGPSNPQFAESWPNLVLNQLVSGHGPNVDHIDIELDQDILDKINVTLGPLASLGSDVLVDSLLKKYTAGGTLNRSCLSGGIKRPNR